LTGPTGLVTLHLDRVPETLPMLQACLNGDRDKGFHAATPEAVSNQRFWIRMQRLLHGVEHTMWPFYREALRLKLDARIGLEDGRLLPSGTEAENNAALIRAACALTG
jgi:uncharacterized protein (DUF849 family)